MTDCQCRPERFPFQCPRHDCQKNERWHHLCQVSAEYFALWESGRGPGQVGAQDVLRTTAPPITVLMVTHNRLEYTQQAVDAVLRSDYPRFELVVWDNASSDGTQDWLIARSKADERVSLVLWHENAGIVRAMNTIWSASEAPLVAKVDNDTLIPPDLLLRLSACHALDGRLGVISGCHFRPEDVGEQARPPAGEELRVHRCSHVGGCAVMLRKSLLDRFGPIPSAPRDRERPFLESGWTQFQQTLDRAGYVNGYPLPLIFVEHMEDTRSPHCISSHEHEEYKRAMRGRTLEQCTDHLYVRGAAQFFQAASPSNGEADRKIVLEPEVTLFIPLAGRAALWHRMAAFLQRQTWPRERMRLLLLDTAGDPVFTQSLRHWIASGVHPDVRHIVERVGAAGLADQPRRAATGDVRQAMARIYNRMLREVTTDYVWILEDDILPPDDVCRRLIRSFDAQTISVAAPYRSRFHDGFVAWDYDGRNYRSVGSGVQTVGGNGFGCVVLKRALIEQFRFSAAEDCDRGFYRHVLRIGWRARLDWSCLCEHGLDRRKEPSTAGQSRAL